MRATEVNERTEEEVILVDGNDQALGTMGKLEAHRTASLHRAFSVFLFDDRGRTLLQQRAEVKYHSPGLWSNTCCGHPRPGESVVEAAERRLFEEMGLRTPLVEVGRFTYKAELGNGLTEHELDHVLVGLTNEDPDPDPQEAKAWRWSERTELADELRMEPHRFTAWFPHCVWVAWDENSSLWVR